MEVSLSWLSKGYKLLKPHKDLGQSHLQGSPTSGSSTAYAPREYSLPPATHPASPLHIPVCIQRVPACVRKAKDPTKFFSLFSFQKNGPIHSCNLWENFLSGSLETAKSGKQQPASKASVVIGPNNNKKQPPPQQQQNMPRVRRHTQTRPQNQTKRTRLQGSAAGMHIPAARQIPWHGAMAAQFPAPPTTICHQHSAYCKCADTVHGG